MKNKIGNAIFAMVGCGYFIALLFGVTILILLVVALAKLIFGF
jgi:hypothetical protein